MSTLLVASGGGHFEELVQLAPRLRGVDQDFVWVLWDGPQGRSLPPEENVIFARPTPPRSPWAVASNLGTALKAWRGGATALVTTGSQFALPFIAVGRARGRPCHFIESAARIETLSLTARIASRIPGTKLYTQYESAATSRRPYVGSVFDGFAAAPAGETKRVMKIVVSLGTMPGYGFTRLVSTVKRIAPEGAQIFWQTGSTDVSGLGVDGRVIVPPGELAAEIAQADVVVAHAGVGTALAALRAGKCPVLVPRSAKLGEHVDDHQSQIGADLVGRGLAIVEDADTLTFAHLQRAADTQIRWAPEQARPLQLV